MATYSERKAAQAEKLAATSVLRRIAMVVFGGIVAFAVALGMNYLLSGEPRTGMAVVIGVAVAAAFVYQYLVVPARSKT
jgi:hypothetical protein